ncbi:MAG: photosystem I assembly protein Ycf3, partial [Prochlorococcaceae cyanobacterium ETNP1_MAG_9]|nr:photosystem I assembly protein Ycf3 [Prochlorococcaceae cyanobacterium ETNP1_MAG_9]
WTKAVRLYPGGYLEIENWLKTTGRSKIDII